MQTKQPVAWLANKSQDPNKERTRHSSVNSKIDSKMTQDTQCVDKIMEAKIVQLQVKRRGRRHGIMLVETLLTKIGL